MVFSACNCNQKVVLARSSRILLSYCYFSLSLSIVASSAALFSAPETATGTFYQLLKFIRQNLAVLLQRRLSFLLLVSLLSWQTFFCCSRCPFGFPLLTSNCFCNLFTTLVLFHWLTLFVQLTHHDAFWKFCFAIQCSAVSYILYWAYPVCCPRQLQQASAGCLEHVAKLKVPSFILLMYMLALSVFIRAYINHQFHTDAFTHNPISRLTGARHFCRTAGGENERSHARLANKEK